MVLLLNDTVSIVLLNYNGELDTIECLESLKKIDYPSFKIFLVDNKSCDESVEKIKSFLDYDEFYDYDLVFEDDLSDYTLRKDCNLVFVPNNDNYGFAGGNNVALKYILENNLGDYVLLLNNDTIVSRDFLDCLVRTSKNNDDDCFVGITHYYYDKRESIQTIGGGLVDMVHGEASAIRDPEYTGNLDFLTGSCILSSLKVLSEVGLLCEDYFMYWEDVDWCTCLREQGYKIRISDGGCIYHKEGSSIKSLNRIYYHTRNRILYMSKHTSGLTYHKFMIYIVLYVMKESLNNRKNKEYTKTLQKGLKDAIKKKIR